MASSKQDVTPKSIALTLGISDKRLRGFIRSEHRNGRSLVKPVGQGNRYGMDASDGKRIVSAFLKAHPSHKMPKAKAPRTPKASAASHAPEAPVTIAPEAPASADEA